MTVPGSVDDRHRKRVCSATRRVHSLERPRSRGSIRRGRRRDPRPGRDRSIAVESKQTPPGNRRQNVEAVGTIDLLPDEGENLVASNKDLAQLSIKGNSEPTLITGLNVVMFQVAPVASEPRNPPALINQFIREFAARRA